jgi:hypothetical protein
MTARTHELSPIEAINEVDEFIGKRIEVTGGKNRSPDESLQGFDQTDDSSEILGAGAALVLVAAANNNRIRQQWGTHEQSAGALWPMKLMGAE